MYYSGVSEEKMLLITIVIVARIISVLTIEDNFSIDH